MNLLIPPSRSTFWRTILAVIAGLSALSIPDLFNSAQKLGVNISTSVTWLAGIFLFGAIALLALLGLAVGFTKKAEQLWGWLEAFDFIQKYFGLALLILALIGFPLLVSNAFFKNVLGSAGWIHLFVFCVFALAGMCGIKSFRKEIERHIALIVFILPQALLHLVLINLPLITAYPFAMGWSETSRYYYPALFLSEEIFDEKLSLPILHPTLHFLLTAPYLFGAPLWMHRFWQVFLRFALVGWMIPALMKRLAIENRTLKTFIGMWMFLFLMMGPIYLHLTIPVLILFYGFSPQDSRKVWFSVLLASIWAGTSRINWYVMPGMVAAALYFLEVPYNGKNFWRYVSKPALWFFVGTLTAHFSMQIYIAFSGIPNPADFFTSLSSPLLWYRLLPNESYPFGLLPASIFVSLPMWIVLYQQFRSRRADWHPVRIFFILAALFVLFVGGLIVSLKIGGGADLHNLDAYFTILWIVFSYLVFARYKPENEIIPQIQSLKWGSVMAVVVIPILFVTQTNIGFKTYDPSRTDKTLATIQAEIDRVNAEAGEILFITQRHLISMGTLENVPFTQEYEREELMEMAMSNNEQFLDHFKQEMQSQRFDLIVVDPLTFKILARRRAFSEENNVWVRGIMRPILCNYRLAESFPEDEIALYVPQEGERVCP